MKKNILLLLFILPGIFACNGTTSSNLRSRTTTHEAVTANINLGVEYMRQGSYEKALDKFERARQIDPGYYQTYNMLGYLYQQLGEMDDAERNYKRAIRLNGNDPNTLNNYGQFLCSINQHEKAEEFFIRATSNPLYRTPEVAYTNAGICALMDDKKNTAESYFRRALELNAEMPESLIRMSTLSLEKNNHLSARGYLQRYLEVANHSSQSLWLGIQIERELGDEDAVSSYALLLRNTFPDSKETELMEQTEVR